MYASVVFNELVMLFGIILIGYVINKLGVIDVNGNKVISNLVTKVTMPAITISSVASLDSSQDRSQVYLLIFAGISLYIFLPLLSKLIVKIFKIKKEDSATYRLLLMFGNTAFVGYPVVKALFGEGKIFHMAILNLPFNIILFSYGLNLLLASSGKKEKISMKTFLHPGIISGILALLIFLFRVPMHTNVTRLMTLVGSATIPLSMIAIGSSLALIPFKSIFTELKVYPLVFIKLLVMPVICFFVAKFFIKDDLTLKLIAITVAMPSGSTNVMLTTQYAGNNKVASIFVFLSTLFSIATIPAIIYLLF